MGKALAEAYPVAKQTFEEADDALGFKLSALCFEGPEDQLKQTEHTQPAILTTSIAALRALNAERPDLAPSVCAGHSLGEWSALVAVGALPFQDAVRAVRSRGQLMQKAVPKGEGAMAAVLGLEPEEVQRVCASIESDGLVLRPANFNSMNQTVISGHAAAVEKAEAPLEEAGAMRVVVLPVSAPFHCPLMEPVQQGLAEVLAPIKIGALSAPVVTNVEAKPNSDSDRVKDLLIQQVTAPVRWVESFQAIAAMDVQLAFEIGPGKVLAGLARRIDKKLKVKAFADPESLQKAIV